MAENLNIFAIYTSEDKETLLHLLGHLKPFEKDFDVSIWHDDPILLGQQWKPQTESHLHQADIVLLLVSNTFMHSEFVKQLEFKMVIDRYKDGKSTVIPIIIDYCQWEIDFKSDDYDFNLNELQVLPEGGKPIKTWDSPKQAYNTIAASVKSVITSLTGNGVEEESKNEEEEIANTKTDEQIKLSFDEEKEAQEEKRRKEEVEAKRIAEENRLKKETEAKARAEEEKRLQEDTEAKRVAEQQRLKKEAEAKRRTEEDHRLREAANQQQYTAGANETIEETEQGKDAITKKRIRLGLLVAVLAIIVIWTFSKFNTASEEQPTHIQASDTIAVKDSITSDEIEVDIPEEEVLSVLEVGETYDDGFVFEIASDGKTGKIAHYDNAGPMTWKNAMNIQEQLGESWRVPTLDELQLMQKTIGPGATNSGEFSNGLYWSATDYDEYQAKLLRFRDGNTSYHYNKEAEHRKFLVRAIRDFSRE